MPIDSSVAVKSPGLLRSVGDAVINWGLKRVLRAENPDGGYSPGTQFSILRPPVQALSKLGLADKQGKIDDMIKAFRGFVFACIHVRAKEIASQHEFLLKLKTGPNELKDVAPDFWLSELLAQPNPYFSNYSFWYLVTAYADLVGNCYLWIARDKLGVPRALWPLEPRIVRIIAGDPKKGEDIIKAYRLFWNTGEQMEIDAKDIVHLKHLDPSNPYYYGGSLLMRAAYEADIIQYIAEYHREFFANNAIPSYMAIFPNGLTPDVRTAFEEQFKDKYRRKPGQTFIAEGREFKLEKLTNDNQEIGFEKTHDLNKHIIQAVFGVPDSKLMVTEHIEARATVETEDYAFQKETIHPLKMMFAGQLTTDLAVYYDKRLIVVPKSTIPRDLKTQAELDKSNIDSGIVAINEVRKREGMPPMKGGEEPLVSYRNIPLSQAGVVALEDAHKPGGNEPPPPEPAKPAKRIKKAPTAVTMKSGKLLTEEMKTNLWKAHSRVQMRHEIRLNNQLKKYFSWVKTDAVASVNAGKSLPKSSNDEKRVVEGYSFNIGEWTAKLTSIVNPETLKILEAAFEEFVADYEIEGAVFAPNTPGVASAIHKVNAKTVTVPDNLLDDLAKELEEGTRLQETTTQIADRVAKFFDNQTDYRAIRIARTVSNYAVNEGNRIAAVDAGGYDTKLWVTQRDTRVRDIHAAVDGVQVPIKGKFVLANGDQLDVPGDPTAAQGESVINCRCTAFYTKSNQ